jgi:endonuclease/exonuclease/phosphatase family metal-dependent hydrolase
VGAAFRRPDETLRANRATPACRTRKIGGMRVAVTTLLIAAATIAVTHATQAPGPRPSRPRIVATLSDLLTHSPLAPCPADTAAARKGTRVRVASWNIRAARTAPVAALVPVIRAMKADVVALQEVDVRTRRSGFVDQPTALGSALGVNYVFAASILWDEGNYGLALVSKWPLVRVARHRVDGADLGEPRIVLDVTICAAGRPLRVLNHHADRRPNARALGFADLRRIAKAASGSDVLLMGDMNEYADGPGVRSLLDAGFVDLGARGALKTAAGGRIDFILADAPASRLASEVQVWPTDKSDHHVLFTDLEW